MTLADAAVALGWLAALVAAGVVAWAVAEARKKKPMTWRVSTDKAGRTSFVSGAKLQEETTQRARTRRRVVVTALSAQLAAAASAITLGLEARAPGDDGGASTAIALGALSVVGEVVGLVLAILISVFSNFDAMGSGWGRPLRLRGRIVHADLSVGTDWARGDAPETSDLDAPTRAALEALWLHDAQKEHASVPAFARVAWVLAAVGAPPELIERAHRAAIEEVDHARRCFALAAAYGGRAHVAEPMPELLVDGLDLRGDPLVHLALESLQDSCRLEDFNADVAGECARVCEDRATRAVLEQIAVEERSHAELSWSLLAWVLGRGGARVAYAVRSAAGKLADAARPTAVSSAKMRLVEAADPARLRSHGRLADAEWMALWAPRVAATRTRALRLLDSTKPDIEPQPERAYAPQVG